MHNGIGTYTTQMTEAHIMRINMILMFRPTFINRIIQQTRDSQVKPFSTTSFILHNITDLDWSLSVKKLKLRRPRILVYPIAILHQFTCFDLIPMHMPYKFCSLPPNSSKQEWIPSPGLLLFLKFCSSFHIDLTDQPRLIIELVL